MSLYSTRPQAGVIKPTLPLINQLAIKPLEREGIAGVFFRSIRKMDIYPVQAFVKAGSTARLAEELKATGVHLHPVE